MQLGRRGSVRYRSDSRQRVIRTHEPLDPPSPSCKLKFHAHHATANQLAGCRSAVVSRARPGKPFASSAILSERGVRWWGASDSKNSKSRREGSPSACWRCNTLPRSGLGAALPGIPALHRAICCWCGGGGGRWSCGSSGGVSPWKDCCEAAALSSIFKLPIRLASPVKCSLSCRAAPAPALRLCSCPASLQVLSPSPSLSSAASLPA